MSHSIMRFHAPPIRWGVKKRLFIVFVWTFLIGSVPALAEPWLEVGDASCRNDLEILAANGVIEGPIETWPIPAGQLASLSDASRIAGQPLYVQLAAKRVLSHLIGDGQPEGLHPEATIRGTDQPDIIRDFNSKARNEVDTRAGLIWDDSHVSAGLRIGEQSRFNGDESKFALDGTYASLLLGNWQLYGGWIDQWYGPGWTSSLILSNNARPFPKIGIMRNGTTPFKNAWLHWAGAWQINTFIGLLDDQRIVSNTAFGSLRISFSPLPRLNIGLTRTTEFCGSGQSCDPINAAFHFNNSNSTTNSTNDEAAVDFKYQGVIGKLLVAPYFQIMNDDNGPFVHSYTSYLAGTSFAGPLGQNGAHWRTTVEYTDSVAALNAFDLGKKIYYAAYNNGQYADGMRYRDRTLGFSLDSDSRLFSFAGLITDTEGRGYRFTYYHADVNIAPPAGSAIYGSSLNSMNSISSKPLLINELELGINVPFRTITLDATLRYHNAQVLPNSGGRINAEAGIVYRF
jgi:hypothetical protein